jgi:hypothetical protein
MPVTNRILLREVLYTRILGPVILDPPPTFGGTPRDVLGLGGDGLHASQSLIMGLKVRPGQENVGRGSIRSL